MKFEAENIDGVIKFTPETLKINKVIVLVRTISSDTKTNNEIVFNHHNKEYNTSKQFNAYGIPQYISDFFLVNDNSKYGVLVDDINEFDFVKIPIGIKLTVELFEHKPIPMENYAPPTITPLKK